MNLSLNLFPRPSTARTRMPKVRRYGLTLEGLEERTVMSHSHMVAALVPPPAMIAAQPAAPALNTPINVTGVNLTGVTTALVKGVQQITGVVGNVTGTIAGLAFQTPITITATPSAAQPAIPVLNLALDPIHLNLLGLHVDTSAICLSVTAQPGPGNLLGNLVGNIANLLNGPAPTNLTGLLGTLNGLLNTVATGAAGTGSSSLVGLLNSGLNSLAANLGASGQVNQQSTGNSVDILNLSVGPLDLNLLGLNVHLDNCANNPVTVDVSAVSGPGNLLGNLLVGLLG